MALFKFLFILFYLSLSEVKGFQQKYNILLSKKINDTTLHMRRLEMMSRETENQLNILDALREASFKHKEYSFTGQNFSDLGFYVQSIGGLYEKPNENKFWFIYELDFNGKHVLTNGLSTYIRNNSHYVFHYKNYDFEANSKTNWLSNTSNYARKALKWFKKYAGYLI